MKKSTILLSLMLVLALSVGAAAQFKISGSMEFDTHLRQAHKVLRDDDGNAILDDDKIQYVVDEDGYRVFEGFEFFGRARTLGTMSLSTTNATSGSLKLTVTFANQNAGSSSTWINWTTNAFEPSRDVQFAPTAKLEATGALWKGGQELTAVVGRHNVNYSSWVASSAARRLGESNADRADARAPHRNAVELKGVQVGPINVSAIYGVSYASGNRYGQDEPAFFNATANFGGLDVKATLVNREVIWQHPNNTVGANAVRDRVWDYAVELGTKPVDGLTLSGIFAIDGQGQGRDGNEFTKAEAKYGFQADATATMIPGLKLTGSLWKAEEGFAPRYAQWHKDQPDIFGGSKKGNFVQFKPNRQGFKVGAETEQSGVTLKGSYQNTTNVTETSTKWDETVVSAGASTTIEGFALSADVSVNDKLNNTTETKTVTTTIGIGRNLSGVDVKYTGTIKSEDNAPTSKLKHVVTASTKADLFFADGVSLNAAVVHNAIDGRLDKDGDAILDYGIDASWKAPNGLNFTVGYATYNKNTEIHGNDKNLPDGFYIRTTAKVSF